MTDVQTDPNEQASAAILDEIRELEKVEGTPAAEAALVEHLRQGEQTPQAFILLSRFLMKQRKFDDALRAALKAKSMAPLEAEPLVAEGYAHMRLRDLDAAATAFAEALRLDSNAVLAMLGAAAVKMADESFDDALELASRALEIDPDLDRARELQARIHIRQKDRTRAIETLKQVVARDPKNERALKALVKVARAEGQGQEIVAFLRAEAEAHPGDDEKQRLVRRIDARAGDTSDAEAEFAEAEASGSVKASDRVRFAMTLIQAKKLDDARRVIDGLGKQKVFRPIIAKLHGDIATRSGDATAAIALYAEACRHARVDPLSPEDEAAASDEMERAKAWRDHTQTAVLEAARQRRSA